MRKRYPYLIIDRGSIAAGINGHVRTMNTSIITAVYARTIGLVQHWMWSKGMAEKFYIASYFQYLAPLKEQLTPTELEYLEVLDAKFRERGYLDPRETRILEDIYRRH